MNDPGFDFFLKQLIDGDKLEDPALGIAKFVLANGQSELSAKQRAVFEMRILQIAPDKCVVCHSTIPWSERYQAMRTNACAVHAQVGAGV